MSLARYEVVEGPLLARFGSPTARNWSPLCPQFCCKTIWQALKRNN